jgi:hypothetical protein
LYSDGYFIYTTALNPGNIVKVEGNTFKGISESELKQLERENEQLVNIP